jgi:voltage-dependent potassium channel beta subunit
MGKTGLQISVLSFGSWVSFKKQIDDQMADRLMGIAYDAGINFFDNAEVYALGESEKMMGRVLKNKQWERSSYLVSSKVYFGWRGKSNKPNQTGLSRKHIFEACKEALQRLGVDYLDLFLCHRPDKNTPIEEVVWAMNHLMQQGYILYWGTSEWSGVEIMAANETSARLGLIGPTVEQPQYNLFTRQKMENEYLKIFSDYGLGTTIWSPLASGLLTGKYNAELPPDSRFSIPGFEWLRDQWITPDKLNTVVKLSDYAAELGISLSALAIGWCLKNNNVTTAILGATKEHQLKENLQALDALTLLTDDVLKRLDDITGTKPILPEY